MRFLLLLISCFIGLVTFQVHSQDFYLDEHDRNFFNASTLLFGSHWNKFDPNFNVLNFDVLDQTGAYDMNGSIIADSSDFVQRGNYIGLGFNVNGVQCLISTAFRRSTLSNYFQVGFGMGFNQVLHFSYKTGQPLIWFEGLVNYNFFKHNTRLRYFEISQPPMMVIDGTQFPNIDVVTDGSYRLNVEFHKHIIEPVAAINFALTRGLGLRFAAGYSLFLNNDNADLTLRFRPVPEDNSGAKKEKMTFNRNIDNINTDGNALTGNHLDMRRWNFNVSLVIRMIGSAPSENEKRTNFY